MDIRITIGNSHLLLIMAFTFIILALSIATAYNPGGSGGVPATMGHSIDELDWSNSLPGSLYVTDQVGIGTTTPGAELHVVGMALADSYLTLNPAGRGTHLGYDTTNDVGVLYAYDWTLTSPRNLVLQSIGGNVGIGVINPVEKLEVDGNIRVTAGNDVCIQGGNCLSTVRLWSPSGSNIYYDTGGVGIGTSTPGTNMLEVAGGPIKATGGLIIQTVASGAEEAAMTKVAGQIWLRTDI